MAITQVNKVEKRKPRESKGNTMTEVHEIFDGRIKVFRVPQSGKKWQMKMWLKAEQKYYKRSLGTEYLDEALQLAEEIFFDIRSKIRVGEVILEKNVKDLVEMYLGEREKDVKNQHITPERLTTIKSQMKHFVNFIDGDNVRLSHVPPKKMKDYETYRREYAKKHAKSQIVKLVTMANELSTIKHFYNYLFDERFLDIRYKPIFPKIEKRSKNEKISRDELTREEWYKIYTYMQTWHKGRSPEEQDQRYFIRYFILLLCASGIRFGEARQLCWHNLELVKKGDEGYLRIDLEKGKTGARTVVCRRFDLYDKLRKLSNHTQPNDIVFVDNPTGEPIKKDAYYDYWHEMLKNLKMSHEDGYLKHIVFYGLRHTYATWSLYAGVDIYDLALNMGTSVKHIEEHYSHVKVVNKWRELVGRIDRHDIDLLLGGVVEHKSGINSE